MQRCQSALALTPGTICIGIGRMRSQFTCHQLHASPVPPSCGHGRTWASACAHALGR